MIRAAVAVQTMPSPSVFREYRDSLERSEFQFGVEGGRLAVSLDLLTDALVMVGQHGVYCQSARQPGKPAMDIQIVTRHLEHAKELVASVLAEVQAKKS